MSARTGNKRQILLTSLGLSLTGVVAVLVVTLLVLNTRTAFGSGTGGGGCFSTTGPSCTFKGNNGFADFSSVSSDQCIFTDVNIQLFASLSQPGHVATQSVFIFLSQYDECNNVQLLFASNQDPNTFMPDFTGTLQFGGKLSSATVTGTAPMFDETNGPPSGLLFTTTVNLTLKGFGSTTQFVNSQHFHGQGVIFNSHFNGTNRNAEASGTLTDASANNLAATPTLNASLGDSTSGTVQIFHS